MERNEIDYEEIVTKLKDSKIADYRWIISHIKNEFDKKHFTLCNGYTTIPPTMIDEIKQRFISSLQCCNAVILHDTIDVVTDYRWIEIRCKSLTQNPEEVRGYNIYGRISKYYIDFNDDKNIMRCYDSIQTMIQNAIAFLKRELKIN